jgi:subtilisin
VRRISLFAASAAALVLLTAGLPATAAGQRAAAAQRYIVVLQDSAAASTVAKAHAATYGLELGHVYRTALKGYSAPMTAGIASALEALPVVKWVEPDHEVGTFAQTTPTGIDRADAELSPTAAIDGTDQRVNVDVAVIDTGVDLDHPDLNVHTAGAKNCTFFGLPLPADDDNGHGSHVSGTIGALDNSIGVVGMAPGARIWPVKVLSAAGVGLNSDVICGIDYVAANADEIEVANMSLGGGGSDDGNCGRTDGDAEHLAICNAVAAGVTFAVAAGNESQDAANVSPAAYDEVITVSALADFNGQPGGGAASTCRADVDDTFADFSNFGADVDIIAPGVCIDSTYMQGMYDTLSGTSMASPHVAGAAALYKANNPGATPAQVKAALQAAGTANWNDADDPDNTKEPLLNVSGF